MIRGNLVETIFDLGPPPEGVDVETYAIAKVPPSELNHAVRKVTPTYEDLVQIRDEQPRIYEIITESPQPDKALGERILDKQHYLSRHRRRAAVALSALALGLGVGATIYDGKEGLQDSDLYQGATEQELKDADKQQLTTSLAFGGAAGIMGGIVTNMGLLLFATPRLAHKPAQRIVRRAEQKN